MRFNGKAMTKKAKKTAFTKTGQPIRIIVVGANFAGLSAAVNLSRNLSVSVIDCRPNFEFLPNIHELLSRVKKAKSLRLDRRRLIERAGHRFIQDTATTIDPVKKIVYTSKRQRLPFDICVVATGGINDTMGISGAVKFGLPFKTVTDCQSIGHRLKDLTSNNRPGPVSIVIVGGGLEGVEALGEILRRYRRYSKLEIHIVDKNDRLLKREPAAIDRDIKKICQPFNIHFHTSTRVTRVAQTKVWLSSGESLPADTTIWTGGALPPPLLRRSGLTEHPGRWVAVNDTLQSQSVDSIFVAGDSADLPKLKSKQAYHAIDMGELVAQNIDRLLAGEDLKEFRQASKPKIISFGDLQTYVIFGGLALASPLLAGLKEGVFQATMAKFDPPKGISSAMNFYDRSTEGLFNLTLPTMKSMLSLKRLTNVRLLT